MLKNVAKYVPFTTIILIYLYVCGSLYLISFWSTFNIDISNIVELTEIPKSFIFPFVIANGFYIFLISINVLTPPVLTPNEISPQFPRNLFWRFAQDPDTYLLIGGLVACFLFIFPDSPMLWIISGTIFSISLTFKMTLSQYVKSIIVDFNLRRYICSIIIITPIYCIVGGKGSGLKIYNNTSIKYIKIDDKVNEAQKFPTNDSAHLKLLGFLGDKLIKYVRQQEEIYSKSVFRRGG